MGTRVVCQRWEESERDWGVRPDGYSLHLSPTDRDEYIKAHNADLPETVPDEYSRPSGAWYYVEVDDETMAELQAAVEWFGVRRLTQPPRPQL